MTYPKDDMKQEDRALILFSRAHVISSLQLSSGQAFDWAYFYGRSVREGVAHIVYHNFKTLGLEESLPDNIRIKFREGYLASAARNTRLLAEITGIIRALGNEGLHAIALKGPLLSEYVYGNIALRPSSDIDILIKKDELARINTVLHAKGYMPLSNYNDCLNHTGISPINSVMYVHQAKKDFYLHLHWHLVNMTWPVASIVSKFDINRVWKDARLKRISDFDMLILSPEHLAIYLSEHAINHCFHKLIFLSDVVESTLPFKSAGDWNILFDEARKCGLEDALRDAIFFAYSAFGIALPVTGLLPAAQAERLKRRIRTGNLSAGERYFLSYKIFLETENGLLNKARFLTRTFFPSTYVMAHSCQIPVSSVRPSHYWRRLSCRIFNNIS